jgi:hypothetical protein
VTGADGLAALALAQTLVEAGRTGAFVYPRDDRRPPTADRRDDR